MRRFLVIFGVLGGVVGLVGAAVFAWRRNPRVGTHVVNDIINPALVRRGLSGRGRSEIGTLEHVGRRSGIRRLTPVHPEATTNGFRIVVPLGRRSEWAANVIAAGHCRLALHDTVYELDEPMLVTPAEIGELPLLVRRIESALGFEYLVLRQFAAAPGSLEPVAVEATMPTPESAEVSEVVDAEEALEPGEIEAHPIA